MNMSSGSDCPLPLVTPQQATLLRNVNFLTFYETDFCPTARLICKRQKITRNISFLVNPEKLRRVLHVSTLLAKKKQLKGDLIFQLSVKSLHFNAFDANHSLLGCFLHHFILVSIKQKTLSPKNSVFAEE